MTPGSTEAIAAGCRCPVIDNGHGQGILTGDEPVFWVSEDCRVHELPADKPGGGARGVSDEKTRREN